MKIRNIMIAVLALALPVMAQETEIRQKPESPEKPAEHESKESAPDKEEKFRARQIKFMEKALKDIGITEEQRTNIFALQETHMEKMKDNWKRLKEARSNLSRLQDESAPMEEIDAAIQKVADAQAEQLRLIAHNRREMETILGKEKNDRLMQSARKQFRRHGRHSSPPLPPRPGSDEAPTPPIPPVESSKAAPPPP